MRERLATVEEERTAFYEVLGVTLAHAHRLSFSRAEAAESLGVSGEFFDAHIAPEIRSVRRGRRRMFPLGEVLYWLWRAADAEGGASGRAAVEHLSTD